MAAEFRYAARASRSGRRRLFFATILVIVIVLLDLVSGGKVRSAVREGASAIWSAGSRAGEAISASGFFSSRHALEGQISALQQELAQSQAQTAAFAVVQAENASLTQMVHLAQTVPGVTAPVSSSLHSSPYGTFLIGAGSGDGLTQGALVLTAEGFVIGKITDVQSHTALVGELFAPDSSLDIVIDGASVNASGQGGGNAAAEVPRGVTVSPGDPVTAREYGGRPVGVVEHVDSDPASAQSKVLIGLPVSLSSLRFVYVTP